MSGRVEFFLKARKREFGAEVMKKRIGVEGI
jgi:hypothetical protein